MRRRDTHCASEMTRFSRMNDLPNLPHSGRFPRYQIADDHRPGGKAVLADCPKLSRLFAREFAQRYQLIDTRLSESPLALSVRPPLLFD